MCNSVCNCRQTSLTTWPLSRRVLGKPFLVVSRYYSSSLTSPTFDGGERCAPRDIAYLASTNDPSSDSAFTHVFSVKAGRFSEPLSLTVLIRRWLPAIRSPAQTMVEAVAVQRRKRKYKGFLCGLVKFRSGLLGIGREWRRRRRGNPCWVFNEPPYKSNLRSTLTPTPPR